MRLVLLGAGGHARSCISCIESAGLTIVGLLDRPELFGQLVSGYPVIGSDNDIERVVNLSDGFLIAIGHLDSPALRIQLYEQVTEAGGTLPVITAATASVDRTAQIGNGSIVMHRVVVNAGARIGINCILNTGAIIEHDATVGNHCHVSTGAIINGGCQLGDRVFVGSGAVVKNHTVIGNDVVIGAGTVVVHDILEPGVYVGSPARRLK